MEKPFKVIIIGGSIAGLTLAHCLSLANIDFIVLEKHTNILETLGCLISLLPHGWRVLDQLGLSERLEQVCCHVRESHMGYADGSSWSDGFPVKIEKRFGYPISMLQRKQLIDVLYGALHDKSRVKTGQEVLRVKSCPDGVEVITECGDVFYGSLAVGADGVHSTTRAQMWKAADILQPGLITEKERQGISIEYSCILGTSTPVPGINPGEQRICCYDEAAIILFAEKNRDVCWALISRLDKTYTYPDAPHLNEKDLRRLGNMAAEFKVVGDIRLKELWARTERKSIFVLQEGLCKTWNLGRIVCVGDSVSKMTPNLAQGANTAIEGAAVLANTIHKISQAHAPSEYYINDLLREYGQSQQKRLKPTHAMSESATRIQTQHGLLRKVLIRYLMPYVPNASYNGFASVIAPAICLDYVPLPARCGEGWTHGSVTLNLKQVMVILAVLLGVFVACLAR